MGVIKKNDEIVNNKIFLGMLGTIPNHEYEYLSVFTHQRCNQDSAASLVACRTVDSEVTCSIRVGRTFIYFL